MVGSALLKWLSWKIVTNVLKSFQLQYKKIVILLKMGNQRFCSHAQAVRMMSVILR